MANYIDTGIVSSTGAALPGTKINGPTPQPFPSNQLLNAPEANTIIGALADIKTVVTRQVSLMSFAADPTGSSDSSAALAAACTALSGGGTLHVPVGTYKIGSNTTVPANETLAFDSSKFSIASAVTLTINGPVDAPAIQIFSYVSAPSPGYAPVKFGPTYQRLNVKWFGAVGDGSTADDGAFNFALAALSSMGSAIQ
ncbi:MAG TPA: hypothetical protein VKT80_17225, partial [Chloroflexota bacterium]|nr:hypothetical protein [Chloroflexota bacterium]